MFSTPSNLDCQRQLTESRENLEQLENWKIQELSKVKHMLLSAENALESERKEKHMLQRLMENGNPGRRDPPDGEDSQESLAALKVGSLFNYHLVVYNIIFISFFRIELRI